MSEYTCHACGRRAGDRPPERPPCELPDPEAPLQRSGRMWSTLFGWTPAWWRPRLSCPAGIPRRDQAAGCVRQVVQKRVVACVSR